MLEIKSRTVNESLGSKWMVHDISNGLSVKLTAITATRYFQFLVYVDPRPPKLAQKTFQIGKRPSSFRNVYFHQPYWRLCQSSNKVFYPFPIFQNDFRCIGLIFRCIKWKFYAVLVKGLTSIANWIWILEISGCIYNNQMWDSFAT